MARRPNQRHTYHRDAEQPPSQPPPPPSRFRVEWILVPVCLLLMAYILRHIQPVISWKQIMESLHLEHPERYTRLGHLCLVGILVVAAARILSGK